jgi:serine/threonine-protein kinase RsbW
MEIPSDIRAAGEVEQRLLEAVAAHGYSDECTFAIRLALEEALTNAIKHGNGEDPDKRVQVRFDVDDERVMVVIRDEGKGFDPDGIPDPTADENIEKPAGRGVMLMRAYTDELTFSDQGREVCMVKRKSG